MCRKKKEKRVTIEIVRLQIVSSIRPYFAFEAMIHNMQKNLLHEIVLICFPDSSPIR